MPFKSSLNPVYGRPLAVNMLGALSVRPAAALLATPFVHLWTAGPTNLLPTALPADFTEATFAGYAAVALPLPLVGPINVDAQHIGDHSPADFLGGAVVFPGQSILGYWVDEAAAGGVVNYMAERFVSPVPIAFVGDFISLDVIFAMTELLSFAG